MLIHILTQLSSSLSSNCLISCKVGPQLWFNFLEHCASEVIPSDIHLSYLLIFLSSYLTDQTDSGFLWCLYGIDLIGSLIARICLRWGLKGFSWILFSNFFFLSGSLIWHIYIIQYRWACYIYNLFHKSSSAEFVIHYNCFSYWLINAQLAVVRYDNCFNFLPGCSKTAYLYI